MKYIEPVRVAAGALSLLDPTGALKVLDSLGMIDLIVALEDATGVAVPAASLREEAFASIETIAELLDQFAEG